MADLQRSLGFIVYAPPLVSDDGRPLAAIHGLERAFPSVRMAWRISEQGLPIPLPQRDEWVAESVTRGKFPLLCNGDENYPVTITGWDLSARLAPGRQPMLDVHARMPLDTPVIAAAADVLEGLSEGVHAFWGHATPDHAAQDIALQTSNAVPPDPKPPPHGLPLLYWGKVRSPVIPAYLGWLNYWSSATAEALGFPDPARDADLLARARRTPSGGWLVPLTPTPLELDDPAHLAALLRAYERFPEIGARTSP